MQLQIPKKRLNARLIGVIVVFFVILLPSVAVVHRWQTRHQAGLALAEGQAASEAGRWDDAARELRVYLSRNPDDLDTLHQYALAELARPAFGIQQLSAAIGAYQRILRLHPTDGEAARQLARLHQEAGDYDEAAYVARRRWTAEPADDEAGLWLARALIGMRRETDAEPVLHAILERNPLETKAYGLLAAIELNRDAQDAALGWLDAAVAAAPDSHHARVQRARFRRIMLADQDGAREDLLAVDGPAPTDLRLALLIAREWVELGDAERPQRLLEATGEPHALDILNAGVMRQEYLFHRYIIEGKLAQLAGNMETATATARRAMADLTGSSRAMIAPLAIRLLLEADQVAEARAVIDEYGAVVAQEQGIAGPLVADLAITDAAVTAAEGNPYGVINRLATLVVRRPNSPEAWKLLARAYRDTDQPRSAMKAMQQHLRLVPDDLEDLLSLARHHRREAPADALALAERAARCHGDSAAAARLVITLRLDALERGEAVDVEALERAIADAVAAHDSAALRCERARLLELTGRANEAEALLKTAADRPDGVPAALKLIDMLQRDGRTAEAADVCRAALDASPHIATTRIMLAELLVQLDRKDEAAATLREATQVLEGHEQLTARLAQVQFELDHGSRSHGIASLEAIAVERPQDAKVRLALLQLPEIRENTSLTERLIADLQTIEGREGVRWRLCDAEHRLNQSDWRQHRNTIRQHLAHCITVDEDWSAPVLVLGELHERLGETREAERVYRKALNLTMRNDIGERLAGLLLRTKQFKEASDVLAMFPQNDPGVEAMRIDLSVGLGDHADAITRLRRFIERHPNDSNGYVLLARLVHQHHGDLEEAQRLLDEADEHGGGIHALTERVGLYHRGSREELALQLLRDRVDNGAGPETLALQARFLEAIGLEAEAADVYEALLAASSCDDDGPILQSGFEHRTGRGAGAIRTLEAAVARCPDRREFQRELAITLAGAPDAASRGRADALVGALLEESPKDARLLLTKARLVLAGSTKGTLATARGLLEEVLAFEPLHVQAHRTLLELDTAERRLDRARDRIMAALGQSREPALVLLQARLERQEGRLRVARQLAESVRPDGPEGPAALRLLTEIYSDEGNFAAAHDAINHALAVETQSAPSLVVRARLYDRQGDWNTAIALLADYLDETGRGDPAVATCLAELLIAQNRLDEAAALLDRASQQHDVDAWAVRLQRLRLAAARGDGDGVLALVGDLRPGDPRFEVHFDTAAAALAQSAVIAHAQAARDIYGRLVEANPSRAAAWWGLARCELRLGRQAEALGALEDLLRIEPQHIDGLRELALILVAAEGRQGDALELIDRALGDTPRDAQLLDLRGKMLTKLERFDEAREALEASIAEAASRPDVRAGALLHLAELDVLQSRCADAQQRQAQAMAIEGYPRIVSAGDRERTAGAVQACGSETRARQ
jgi:predicted Zn-dependent protease